MFVSPPSSAVSSPFPIPPHLTFFSFRLLFFIFFPFSFLFIPLLRGRHLFHLYALLHYILTFPLILAETFFPFTRTVAFRMLFECHLSCSISTSLLVFANSSWTVCLLSVCILFTDIDWSNVQVVHENIRTLVETFYQYIVCIIRNILTFY